MHANKRNPTFYLQFILIIHDNYILQVAANSELANTESLPLGEIKG